MGASQARNDDAKLLLAIPVHKTVGARRLLDPSVSKCCLCGSVFSLLRRKHYCRRCGTIVCRSCTSFRFYCNRIPPYPPKAGKAALTEPKALAVSNGFRVCSKCNSHRSAVETLPDRCWRMIVEFAGPVAHHNALQSCRRLQLVANLPFPDGSGWDAFFGDSTFLAKGANGEVYKSVLLPHMASKLGLRPTAANGGATVAVKVINKNTIFSLRKWHHLMREVQAMEICQHPHILRLHGVFQTPKAVYIVLDYAAGGDLFDWLVARRGCSEAEVKILMRQLLTALQHMHDNCGAVHRDVKPENLLLMEKCRSVAQIPKIVLGDFGFARVFPEAANPRQVGTAPTPVDANIATELLKEHHLMTAQATPCGTLGFAPPEVIVAYNARKAHPAEASAAPVTPVMLMMKTDIFAAGITMCLLLTGMEPFPCHSSQANVFAVNQGINFDAPQWSHVSPSCRLLIRSMLASNADERPSAYDALKSPWFGMFTNTAYAQSQKLTPGSIPDAIIQQSIRSLRKNVGATYAAVGQGIKRVTAVELERVDAKTHSFHAGSYATAPDLLAAPSTGTPISTGLKSNANTPRFAKTDRDDSPVALRREDIDLFEE